VSVKSQRSTRGIHNPTTDELAFPRCKVRGTESEEIDMINVEDPRQRAYLELLERGLVAIRNHARTGQTTLCEIEADHIHNIPSLLNEVNERRHLFYIIQERGLYLERLRRLVATEYLELRLILYTEPWQVLASVSGVVLSEDHPGATP
jgi:hypothetical protein